MPEVEQQVTAQQRPGLLRKVLHEWGPGQQEEQSLSGIGLMCSLERKRGARKQGCRNGGSCTALTHILPRLGRGNNDCGPCPQEGGGAQTQEGQGKKHENGVQRVCVGTRKGVGVSLAPHSLGKLTPEHLGVRLPSCSSSLVPSRLQSEDKRAGIKFKGTHQ